MREGDVTGDGVLDLVVTAPDSVVVYVCDHGRYQDYAATNIETYHDSQPIIVTITDMNRDGIDEIVTLDGDDRVRDVNVVEWDGHTFQLLNAGKCSLLLGPSWPYAQDTNGDGKLELVLKQAIPIWSEYVDGLPWRKETRTCAWNGTAFVLTRTEITTTPQFRFQAVQDGDRASLAGDYAKALGLYQQAIFDDKLEPWSLDRYFYETGQFQTQLSGGTETPVPFPTPDPAEYPLLAAYARYRIMLLHVFGNHLPEAKTVYDTLQDKYPSGQVGHVMAELAAAFWSEYQGSHNVGRACDQAVAYARLHPTEVLAYLGNGVAYDKHFGDQSLIYTPETVCPFR